MDDPVPRQISDFFFLIDRSTAPFDRSRKNPGRAEGHRPQPDQLNGLQGFNFYE